MISGLAFLILSQSQLPLIDLGGVQTPVSIPTWKPDPVVATVLPADGWNYRFVDGNLVGRSRGTGEWDEVADLGAKAAATPSIKWPMKFFVSSSIDQVGKTPYGFWMARKYSIDGDELRGLRRETALFIYMVRAYTNGRVQIEPDFEVDTESVFAEVGQSTEDVLRESLLPRLISAKGYRSCFAVTAALDYRKPTEFIGSVPTTYVPFYASYDPSRNGMLARTMFDTWIEQLQAVLSKRGMALASPAVEIAEPSLGRSLPLVRDPADVMRSESLWQFIPQNDGVPAVSSGVSTWAEVADNPWSKLPKLDPVALQVKATEAEVQIGGIHFDFDRKGAIVSGGKAFVQERYADLFAPKLGKPLGYFPVGGRVIVVFESTATTSTDADLLGSAGTPLNAPPAQSKQGIPFDAKEAEGLATTGYFEAKTVVDSDRGAVGDLRSLPRPGHGAIRLLGDGTPRAVFDGAKTPLIQFWVKTGTVAPVELVFEGAVTERYQLFGRRAGAPGGTSDNRTKQLNIPNDGTWQLVSIILDSKQPVYNVYLGYPEDAYFWSPINPGPGLVMDDFKVSELPSNWTGTVTPVRSNEIPAIAEAQDPWSRAAWAANNPEGTDKLRTLLADRDYTVALNALMAFGTRKDAAAIPALVNAVRGFTVRPTRLAFQALAAQGSDEGWTAIRKALTQGPFDLNKREAARLITDHTKESKLAGEMSLMFVSNSWLTRKEAAIALSKVEGNPAKIVSLSFINGSEGAVRAAAIRVADPTVKEVADRLMSVIDPVSEPSDYLRALAAVKLVSLGGDKAIAAWKSVDKLVPDAIIVFLSELPKKDDYRAGVDALKQHSSESVRSAAAKWADGN